MIKGIEWQEILDMNLSKYRTMPHDVTYYSLKKHMEDEGSFFLCISCCAPLSEDFIRTHSDSVDWVCISHYQDLSESFIREFQDKVDWANICWKQKLSESFIREFWDKMKLQYLSNNSYISNETIMHLKTN